MAPVSRIRVTVAVGAQACAVSIERLRGQHSTAGGKALAHTIVSVEGVEHAAAGRVAAEETGRPRRVGGRDGTRAAAAGELAHQLAARIEEVGLARSGLLPGSQAVAPEPVLERGGVVGSQPVFGIKRERLALVGRRVACLVIGVARVGGLVGAVEGAGHALERSRVAGGVVAKAVGVAAGAGALLGL